VVGQLLFLGLESAKQELARCLNPGGPSGVKPMDTELLHYTSGEEIQVGDRVQYGGTFATVVVVSDGETYQLASGYEDHAGAERGLIICDDDGSLTTLNDTDEQLIFVERGTV
jgi:hypothetical protein